MATSRPGIIWRDSFHPTLLELDEQRTVDDVLGLYQACLAPLLTAADVTDTVKVLAERNLDDGNLLHARFTVAKVASQGPAALTDVASFPSSMAGVYAQSFSSFKAKVLGGSDELYARVFATLVAARSPVPLSLLGESLCTHVRSAVNLLVVDTDGCVRFVHHRSMADWLKSSSAAEQGLAVKAENGIVFLAELCLENPTNRFALRHALFHLCEAGREKNAAEMLLDVSWLLTALQDKDVDPVALVIDADPFLDNAEWQEAADVLRVLEKGANALRKDPRELASQLCGRLQPGHPALRGVDEHYKELGLSWLKPMWPSLEPARSPLRKTLLGHGVCAVALCHELDMIVSGSFDKTAKVWKASTGELLRTLEGHSDSVQGVAVAAELDMIVSGSRDNTVKVWKASTGELLRSLEGHRNWVSSVAVAATLDMVVSGSFDETAKVWKASTGELLRTLEGHSGMVSSVALAAPLDMIVSGSAAKIKLWRASTGELLRTLAGHTGDVTSLVVTELGMIVSGSGDMTVKVWKASTGKLLRTLEGHSYGRRSVAVAAALDLIVSGVDTTVKVWRASTGELLRTLEGHYFVMSVGLAAEVDMIVSASLEATAKVWRASTGELLRTPERHSKGVTSVFVEPKLDMIVSGSEDETVKVWKASTGELLRTLEGNSSVVWSVEVTAELDMIVCVSTNYTAKVWRASTGELLRTFEVQWMEPNMVTVAAELDMIVSSGLQGPVVDVWKASTGQLQRTLVGHTLEVTSVAVAAELDMIVSGSQDKTVKVWKASTGELLRTLEGHSQEVTSVAVAADLDVIVSADCYGKTLLWDIATGQQVHRDAVPATRGVVRPRELHGERLASALGCATGFSTDASCQAARSQSGMVVFGDDGGHVHIAKRVN